MNLLPLERDQPPVRTDSGQYTIGGNSHPTLCAGCRWPSFAVRSNATLWSMLVIHEVEGMNRRGTTAVI
eukprot:scaffold244036_cov26-Prasinocladus_malaysianus.AAC.1